MRKILNCFVESKDYKSERLDISFDDPSYSNLESMQGKNLRQINFAHLNINSLRNKFDALVDQIKGNFDILVKSETKFDESFSEGQFKVLSFTLPFRRDRNELGEGIMVFVREDIPSKVIS